MYSTKQQQLIKQHTYSKQSVYTSGADLGGPRGPLPPFKIFYLYVTATMNSMKITFNDV